MYWYFYYENLLKTGKLNHEIEKYYNHPAECDGDINDPDWLAIAEYLNLRDWLAKFPSGILSLVSDTFDLWKLIKFILPRLKDEIQSREGKLVIRPDSGDPVDIICGNSTKYKDLSHYFDDETDLSIDVFEDVLLDEVSDMTPHGEIGPIEHENIYIIHDKLYHIKISNIEWDRYDKQYYFISDYNTPEITYKEIPWSPSDKGVIKLLYDIFGGTKNSQGFINLNPHIGAIYGDSINLDRQVQIYQRLADKGFAVTNIILGIGSFTYVFLTRDSMGFAAKGSWFKTKDGKEYNIFKDPITDDGTKKSLKGMICVTDDMKVIQEATKEEEESGLLRTIYQDGKFYNQTTIPEIRDRINQELNKRLENEK